MWDTYGVLTAIGLQWQYHIKTQRGSGIDNSYGIEYQSEFPSYLQYDREVAKDHEAREQNKSLEP